MALSHELGEHCLDRCRCVKPRNGARGRECWNECPRHNDVCDSDGREEHFAERAPVDDAPVVIDSLKCLKRSTAITELAEIIVLENPRACFGGKGNQLVAA